MSGKLWLADIGRLVQRTSVLEKIGLAIGETDQTLATGTLLQSSANPHRATVGSFEERSNLDTMSWSVPILSSAEVNPRSLLFLRPDANKSHFLTDQSLKLRIFRNIIWLWNSGTTRDECEQ